MTTPTSGTRQLLFLCSGNYYRSRFGYDLHRLESALHRGDRPAASMSRKKALRSGRQLLRTSRKAARHLIDAGRLMGAYHWMNGDHRKAARWWGRSLQKGEAMDARLHVARLCLEIGRRLSEPASPRREMQGVSAGAYLEKAGQLFRELELCSMQPGWHSWLSGGGPT